MAADQQLVAETLRDYQTGDISIGRVGEILGLHVMDVQHVLKEHHIPLNMTIEDVKQAVATLRQLRLLQQRRIWKCWRN